MPRFLRYLPLILFVATFIPLVSSQWIYPPQLPADHTLSDYTSGKATPIEYIIHDAIIGNFQTPKPSFSIMRCAQEGRTEPINPSSESFNSTQGHVAADGTWQVMDSYSDGGFENIYSKGKNLWIIADFETLVGNSTTGRICWWELYSVSSKQVQTPFDPITGISRNVPQVTLLGEDGENYFPSTPFMVNTQMRAGNRNYTWGSGGGRDNRASSTTISVSNQPTGAASTGKYHGMGQTDGKYSLLCTLLGMVFGFVV